MKQQLQEVSIDLIDEDVPNHRLITDPLADAEQVASIKKDGVQQPIKLNKKPDGRFTVVFGFRRKKNSLAAGLKTIPAMVVEGLSNSEIRALQAIENIERQNLHPLEEAQFCQDLADSLQADHDASDIDADLDIAAAIASQIGRDPKWVEIRLALARLSPRVKKAFLEGDIYLGHAQQIAKLATHEAQEEVLGYVAAKIPGYVGGPRRAEGKQPPKTIAETRNHVENRLRELVSVPWKLDAEFDDKPACIGCPHNSATRLELFDGDEPKKPTCLKAPCFEEKRKAAQRAVNLATNTLCKKEGEPAPALAREAIKERNVEFIHPKFVVQAAKDRQAKGKGKKSSAAQSRGHMQYEKEQKINDEYRSRLKAWQTPIHAAIEEQLPYNDPIGCVMMQLIDTHLVEYADRGWGSKTRIKMARQLLPSAFALLKSPSADSLAKLALKLQPIMEIRPDVFSLNGHWEKPFTRQALCETYGIKVTDPAPDRKKIEKELFPSAEKAETKKKRVVKKAGGKKARNKKKAAQS